MIFSTTHKDWHLSFFINENKVVANNPTNKKNLQGIALAGEIAQAIHRQLLPNAPIVSHTAVSTRMAIALFPLVSRLGSIGTLIQLLTDSPIDSLRARTLARLQPEHAAWANQVLGQACIEPLANEEWFK